jgi:hypothetical protein
LNNKLVLKRHFEILVPIHEVETKLKAYSGDDFYIESLPDGRFKALSNVSIGTLILKGMPSAVDGIKTLIILTHIANNRTQVALETKVRIELVFIIIVWVAIVLAHVVGNADFLIWAILGILPVVLVWFWFIYRLQEKALQLKVETFLKDL